MTLGFTGTSRGMTQRQRASVRYLFRELQLTVLHHGDCIGADEEAHGEAIMAGVSVVIHQPTDQKKRAMCSGDRVTVLGPRPYLARNRDIALCGVDGLIAAPEETTEVLRSGTWMTIRAARKLKRRIWIVFQDGTFCEEPAK